MTTSNNFKPLINNDSTVVALGELVRSLGDNGFTRAKADFSISSFGFLGVNGSAAVSPGSLGSIYSSGGDVDVLLEPGLSPSAGQKIYVSASTAGRGTTIPPQVVVEVGTIEDASSYSLTGLVTCALNVDTSATNATWPLPTSLASPNMRYFALDGVSGDDSRLGYSDSSPSAAGAAAVKTAARLTQVLPRDGRGRAAMLLIRSANYVELTSFLMGLRGYYYFLARATCDDLTAGSVAFSDDINDRNMNGNVTATGMFVAGYNPTGTMSLQSIQLAKFGGGSPGFPAEVPISLPGGARWRFDINTSTAALRGVRRSIVKVSGGDTVGLDRPLPALPTAADKGYIEMPGAIFLSLEGSCDGITTTSYGGSYQVSGLQAGGTVNGANRINMVGPWQLANCWYSGSNASSTRGPGAVGLNSVYTKPDGTSQETNGCCRTNGSFSVAAVGMFVQVQGGTAPYAGSISIGRTGSTEIGNSFVVVGGLYYGLLPGTAQDTSNTDPNCIGTNVPLSSQGYSPCRILGPGTVAGLLTDADSTICALDIIGCGSKPAFVMRGVGLCTSIVGPLTGSSGNNDVGLDLQHAQNCTVFLPSTPTLTGAAGDVRLANGSIVPWSMLTLGFVDSAGNRFIGIGAPTGAITFSGNLNGNESAMSSYLADAGFNEAPNNSTPLRRPTSNRLVKSLRTFVSFNTFGTELTVELYKNGSPTGQKVTYDPGVVGAKVDSSHPIIFKNTDTFDVVVSNSDADPGSLANVAGMLEYAV